MQRTGEALPHLAGADDEYSTALEPVEALLGHGDGGLRDGRDVAGDGGLGANTLANLEGVAEQRVEDGADRSLGGAGLPGGPDLAEDLVLADDRRIEAGRHGEQVAGRIGVVEAGEVVAELLGRDMGGVLEELPDVLVATVELLGEGVDLDAVAGREHHRLGDVLTRGQVGKRLGEERLGDRHALEKVERNGAVVQSDDDDRHGSGSPAIGWIGRRCAGTPRRGTSIPARATD